jgi:hypothetical protein
MRIRHLIALIAGGVALALAPTAHTEVRRGDATRRVARVELRDAPPLSLPGQVDSNSPAIWDLVGGQHAFFVMTSANGRPSTATGAAVHAVGSPQAVSLEPWPGGGIWMEAVIKDVDGTWYGYYHNENVATMCRSEKVIPRIGAARSRDRGLTWEHLGIVLQAPPRAYDCTTPNEYFVGGVGDFSVQLDAASRDLYFFYSLYLRAARAQGVGVARLAWADRDAPTGKIAVWRGGAWTPPTATVVRGQQQWSYPAATPIFTAAEAWHDDDAAVDAYWGPSVHWNTYLERYVMLLNRAKDSGFQQEGIYVSYAPAIDDPQGWSAPANVLKGGGWYPQVIGLETGTGTDKVAGAIARLFISGTSEHYIRFFR